MRAQDVPVASDYGLSAREAEVLRRIVRGLTDEQIAAELRTPAHAVRASVDRVLRKMGCPSRTQAAVRVIRQSLLDDV